MSVRQINKVNTTQYKALNNTFTEHPSSFNVLETAFAEEGVVSHTTIVEVWVAQGLNTRQSLVRVKHQYLSQQVNCTVCGITRKVVQLLQLRLKLNNT